MGTRKTWSVRRLGIESITISDIDIDILFKFHESTIKAISTIQNMLRVIHYVKL